MIVIQLWRGEMPSAAVRSFGRGLDVAGLPTTDAANLTAAGATLRVDEKFF